MARTPGRIQKICFLPMSAANASHTAFGPRSQWVDARRVVVKIGSSLLADRETGQLKEAWLGSLADDVAALIKAGKEVIIVSSGAIALGRHMLSLPRGALALEQSQ